MSEQFNKNIEAIGVFGTINNLIQKSRKALLPVTLGLGMSILPKNVDALTLTNKEITEALESGSKMNCLGRCSADTYCQEKCLKYNFSKTKKGKTGKGKTGKGKTGKGKTGKGKTGKGKTGKVNENREETKVESNKCPSSCKNHSSIEDLKNKINTLKQSDKQKVLWLIFLSLCFVPLTAYAIKKGRDTKKNTDKIFGENNKKEQEKLEKQIKELKKRIDMEENSKKKQDLKKELDSKKEELNKLKYRSTGLINRVFELESRLEEYKTLMRGNSKSSIEELSETEPKTESEREPKTESEKDENF